MEGSHPRFRLLRSRAFWLGVPGLVFLLWAWADSLTTSTRANFMWKASRFSDTVIHNAGSLDFIHWPGAFGGSLWARSFRVDRDARVAPDNCFPMPGIRGHVLVIGSVHRTSRLIVPHWCLVLFYLIPWAGLIVWRWWTVRRASKQVPVN